MKIEGADPPGSLLMSGRRLLCFGPLACKLLALPLGIDPLLHPVQDTKESAQICVYAALKEDDLDRFSASTPGGVYSIFDVPNIFDDMESGIF